MGFFDEMKGSLTNVGMGISQKANSKMLRGLIGIHGFPKIQ